MLVIGIFALLTSVAADFVVRRGRTRIDGAATGASAHHGRAEGRHTTPVVEEMIIPVATARRDAFA